MLGSACVHTYIYDSIITHTQIHICMHINLKFKITWDRYYPHFTHQEIGKVAQLLNWDSNSRKVSTVTEFLAL